MSARTPHPVAGGSPGSTAPAAAPDAKRAAPSARSRRAAHPLGRLTATALWALAAALASACSRGTAPGDTGAVAFERLDRFVARHMRAWSTPGLALAVTDRDRLLRLSVYGVADLSSRAPLTPEHRFEIGSISKSFTAIALMQERENGRFDPQAPVTRYLPWFRVRTRHAPLTGHHLLTHTGGIPGDRDDIPPSAPMAMVAALSERQTGYAPGIHYAYANTGYQVLGILLETLAAQPYPDVIRARILAPLGMVHTEAALTNALRPSLAVGYVSIYDDRPYHRSHPLAIATWQEYGAGDGGVSSTPADLATYLRMLLNHGAAPGGRLISEESFALLIQRAIPSGEGWRYGYALRVREEDGHTIFGHSGGMVGYSSMLLGDLEDGVGVVVFVNGPGEPEEVATYALRLLTATAHGKPLPEVPEPGFLAREGEPAAEPASAAAPAPTAAPAAAAPGAGEYAGTYHAEDGRALEVTADGDGLVLLHAGRRIPLERRGENAFLAVDPDFALFLVRFGRAEGRVVEMSYGPDWYTGERYSGPRRFDAPAAWEGYAGHYRTTNPWSSNFRVFTRKGRLWIVSPDGEESALEPAGPATFRVGDSEFRSDVVRFGRIVEGKALEANYSGVAAYRSFTP